MKKIILGLIAAILVAVGFAGGLLVERHIFSRRPAELVQPELHTPAANAVLTNCDPEKKIPLAWEFSRSEVPGATAYKLQIFHPNKGTPYINMATTNPEYRLRLKGLQDDNQAVREPDLRDGPGRSKHLFRTAWEAASWNRSGRRLEHSALRLRRNRLSEKQKAMS